MKNEKTETLYDLTKEQWLEARAKDITSSEIAALFDCSPYLTSFELWHRKKNGDVTSINENERMKWGNRLEAVIAQGVCDDHGWKGGPFKDYMRLPELRIGASFDWRIRELGTELSNAEDDSLLEIKNVDGLVFRTEWLDDGKGSYEAPPHIELQVQHQLLVSGLKRVYLAALIGGNDLKIIERHRNEAAIELIKKTCADFWKSIDDNVEPNPDFNKDVDYITAMYNEAKNGKVMIIGADQIGNEVDRLVGVYKEAANKEKEFTKQKKSAKAELLTMIGDASKVQGEGWSISCGEIAGTRVEAYDKKGYRNFKVNVRKVQNV